MLNASQRKLKTDIFDKYDQFSQFKIKRFYLKINIIKLFKSIMTAKIKQIDQKFVRFDKVNVIISFNLFLIFHHLFHHMVFSKGKIENQIKYII